MLAMAMTTEARTNVWMMMLEKPWLCRPLRSWAFCSFQSVTVIGCPANSTRTCWATWSAAKTSLTFISISVTPSP